MNSFGTSIKLIVKRNLTLLKRDKEFLIGKTIGNFGMVRKNPDETFLLCTSCGGTRISDMPVPRDMSEGMVAHPNGNLLW